VSKRILDFINKKSDDNKQQANDREVKREKMTNKLREEKDDIDLKTQKCQAEYSDIRGRIDDLHAE
jgi:uncharacterized protein YlxW (UPF0749 family)